MAGKGIGGFGSQKKMLVPEGFSESSLTWLNMARVIVDGLADSWFEDLQPVSISNYLTPAESLEIGYLRSSIPEYFGEPEVNVLPSRVENYNPSASKCLLTNPRWAANCSEF
jgi:hypothetical protein